MAERVLLCGRRADGALVEVLVNTDGSLVIGNAGTPATVVGNVASGVADAGAPVKIGGVFKNALEALVDGQRGDVLLDAKGRVITNPAGGVAAGVADDATGPLKVGGVVNSSAQAWSNGQRAVAQFSTAGELIVRLRNGNGSDVDINHPNADGVGTGFNILAEQAFNLVYNGVTWDRQRTPIKFIPINVAIVAGTPAVVWTPAAGKKFRIMGWMMCGSAIRTIIFKDSATEMWRIIHSAAALTPNGMGNGYLSAVANNTLQLDVSVNDTILGVIWGTEE